MDDTKAIALSDFSFFSKIIMAFTWLLKSCVVFSIFFALIPLKYFLYMENKNDYMLLFIGAILAYSIAFLIYYIISEGILKEMILGFVLTIIGSAIAFFIPPVGIIIVIIGVISMIRRVISFLKMIPMLLFGFLLAALLFSDELFTASSIYFSKTSILFTIHLFRFHLPVTTLMSAYMVLTAITSLVLCFKYSLKNAMMRQVVILMAIPITALIIWLIKTKLSGALYNPSQIQQVSVHNGKVFVSGYYRSNGTYVHSYLRNLPHKL